MSVGELPATEDEILSAEIRTVEADIKRLQEELSRKKSLRLAMRLSKRKS